MPLGLTVILPPPAPLASPALPCRLSQEPIKQTDQGIAADVGGEGGEWARESSPEQIDTIESWPCDAFSSSECRENFPQNDAACARRELACQSRGGGGDGGADF